MKYKEEGQKELWSTLFSSLPQTLQTELAKEVTELQSQVTQPSTVRNIVLVQKKKTFPSPNERRKPPLRTCNHVQLL